jgi:hypothetical protein
MNSSDVKRILFSDIKSFTKKTPFSVTKNTKLQDFQYKLIHRILITNSFLHKCGLKEIELCTFCAETNVM